MLEKEKHWKWDFLIKTFNILIMIGNIAYSLFYFYQSKLSFYFWFLNCEIYQCGQLSKNYIKHDLDDPTFSCTTILRQRFSWTTLGVYAFKLKPYDYNPSDSRYR